MIILVEWKIHLYSSIFLIVSNSFRFTKILSLASNHTWEKKYMNMLWDYIFHIVGRLWSCSGVLAPQKSANIHLKGLHIPWSPIVWAEWTCAFSCWAPIICSKQTMKGTRWGCSVKQIKSNHNELSLHQPKQNTSWKPIKK